MKIFVSSENKWKWILIYIPIILAFVIGISLSIHTEMRENAPWQVAANALKHDPRLITRLGQIHSVKLISESYHKNVSGYAGRAKLIAFVSGGKNSAKVIINLQMQSGIWEVGKIHMM